MDLFAIANLSRFQRSDALRLRYEQWSTEWLVWILRLGLVVNLFTLSGAFDASWLPASARLGGLGFFPAVFYLYKRLRVVDQQGEDAPAYRWMEPLARIVRPRRSGAVVLTLVAVYAILDTQLRPVDDVTPWVILFPWLLIGFRMFAAERWVLHLAIVGVVSVLGLIYPYPDSEELMMAGVVNAITLGIGLGVNRRFRRRFLREWSQARERAEESARLRAELEYAREIQLSMLPREAPKLSWLEVSSFSLPATEVGGDYYDYFPLEGDRLVVVSGDVAGHGFASGLMICGIRSCLTLMAPDVTDGPEVLSRLNRMVRETSRRRMMVTLALLSLDGRTGYGEITSAGHPPLLIRRREGPVEVTTLEALPLGSRLQNDFPSSSIRLGAGDVALMYTDGLYELVNARGEPYGLHRLTNALGRMRPDSSAQEVRDALIEDLWLHRGDVAQEDDITLVVLRRLGA